jgi:microcystin synthetase protein McyA
VPDSELSATIQQQGNAVQALINVAEGPLLLLVYMNCGPTRAGRLLVVVHHLVADLHALRILLDDLLSGYQQLQQGQVLQLAPKTTPLPVWGARLQAYAQSAEQRAAVEAWCQLPWNAIPALPRDYPSPREAAICSSQQTIRMALDADTTQRLIRRLLAHYQAQLVEGLIAGLLYSLMRWSQAGWFGLVTVDAGRNNLPNAEELDMSRTVGWVSVDRYLIVERAAGSAPQEVLAAMLGQLRRAPGLAYDLHRYVSGNPAIVERLKGLPRYEIFFNYTGQMLNTQTSLVIRPSVEDCDSQGSPDDRLRYVLECWPALINGQLSLRLLYSTRLHRRETIERLGREFLAALQALAAPE